MKDGFGRKINYLRISVTDLCSLRCIYCMPEHGISKICHTQIMSVEDIEQAARAAAAIGVEKIRITGGEPLVRRGIVDICRRVAAVEGIRELCITTNGVLLEKYAAELKDAGVSRLNISIDTLDSEKYRRITRVGDLETVLRGMEAAKKAGFTDTKLNVVLLGGINDDEIPAFCELTRNEDIQVRFIELMPLGQCADWDRERFITGSAVLTAVPDLKDEGISGVARVYRLPGAKGTVGLINPMSGHFCPGCDRIRLTADGKLKPCLHSDQEIDIRGLDYEATLAAMKQAVLAKPDGHKMTDINPCDSHRNMNEIGG